MRTFPRLRLAIVVLTILLVGAPARVDVETFRLQWASIDTYILPIWSNATTTVSLEPWSAPDGSGTGYHLYGPTGAEAGTITRFGSGFDLYFVADPAIPNHARSPALSASRTGAPCWCKEAIPSPGPPISSSTSNGKDTALDFTSPAAGACAFRFTL